MANTNNYGIHGHDDLTSTEICLPYPVVCLMSHLVNSVIDLNSTIRNTLTAMGQGEKTIKKAELIIKLMDNYFTSWTSNDIEIQTFITHLILYVYKKEKTDIENVMYESIDKMYNDAVNSIITEDFYKEFSEIIMRLKTMYSALDKLNLNNYPTGSWYNDTNTNKTLIKLNFEFNGETILSV